MKIRFVRVAAIALVMAAVSAARAADAPVAWGDFPAGKSPKEIGTRIAENLLTRLIPAANSETPVPPASPTRGRGAGRGPGFGTTAPATMPAAASTTAPDNASTEPTTQAAGRGRGRRGTPPPPGARPQFAYPEMCAAYGSLRFAGFVKDQELVAKLVKRYDPILTPQGAAWFPRATSVDTSMLGALPLELYLQTGNKDYIPLGKDRADTQWSVLLNDEPITSQARGWIDDMFMIPAVQMQAYRATKDKQYMDHAALTASVYLRRLQRDDGLFYHRIPPEGATTPNAPFYWSRGNGWVAAGLSEILINLPKDHEHYKDILAGYQKMMAGLLKTQGADGMWHQLLDHPESFAETSGTGMFTFAFALGVKNGWLEGPAYKEATKKAWIALAGYVDEKANVRDVCAGTNPTNDVNFYLNRPRVTGDLHGQAATVWAAWAMMQ